MSLIPRAEMGIFKIKNRVCFIYIFYQFLIVKIVHYMVYCFPAFILLNRSFPFHKESSNYIGEFWGKKWPPQFQQTEQP